MQSNINPNNLINSYRKLYQQWLDNYSLEPCHCNSNDLYFCFYHDFIGSPRRLIKNPKAWKENFKSDEKIITAQKEVQQFLEAKVNQFEEANLLFNNDEKQLKEKKYVRCIKNNNVEHLLTLNKKYEILTESPSFYEILDDQNYKNSFFKLCFKLITEESEQSYVLCIDNKRLEHRLTENKNYEIISETQKFIRIIDDKNEISNYTKYRFKRKQTDCQSSNLNESSSDIDGEEKNNEMEKTSPKYIRYDSHPEIYLIYKETDKNYIIRDYAGYTTAYPKDCCDVVSQEEFYQQFFTETKEGQLKIREHVIPKKYDKPAILLLVEDWLIKQRKTQTPAQERKAQCLAFANTQAQVNFDLNRPPNTDLRRLSNEKK